MLKLNPDPQFTDDVEITVPGQKELGTISLTFKYRGRKEYSEFLDWLGEKVDKKGKVTEKGKTVAEAFPEFVTGWQGMDVEFNKENIEAFLNNYPAAYLEIFSQYSRLLLESRAKN